MQRFSVSSANENVRHGKLGFAQQHCAAGDAGARFVAGVLRGGPQQTEAITAPAATGLSSRDLRALLWASIDNDDSRDLDQLSVAQPLSGGSVKILVAIVDVDAIVQRGSPIDDHARNNTTSVYTVSRIFPMLPEKPALALNTFLGKRRQADPTRFADLSLCVIELLSRGEYKLDLPGQEIEGQFGLAVND